MPRERNEGFGDVQYAYKSKVKTSLAYRYYKLPDAKNFALNKYRQPSYHQVNIEARYAFKGIFSGVELRALRIN